jgi:glutamate racemase
MKIGIFDSGVGGLTVLREALGALPGERYLYYADIDHVPYGNKTKAEVRGFAFDAIRFLAARGAQVVVVACNTATSVAIEDLRAHFDFPIIGMEPAVKPAVLASGDKRVLVLATEMTLREPKFHDLVAKVDREGVVDYLPMQELVAFAERFEFSPKEVLAYLKERMAGLHPDAYGTVVLGCTHFLFFRTLIRSLFPPATAIIDGNAGTIQRLAAQVANLAPEPPGSGGLTFYRSGLAAPPSTFQRYLALLEI